MKNSRLAHHLTKHRPYVRIKKTLCTAIYTEVHLQYKLSRQCALAGACGRVVNTTADGSIRYICGTDFCSGICFF